MFTILRDENMYDGDSCRICELRQNNLLKSVHSENVQHFFFLRLRVGTFCKDERKLFFLPKILSTPATKFMTTKKKKKKQEVKRQRSEGNCV